MQSWSSARFGTGFGIGSGIGTGRLARGVLAVLAFAVACPVAGAAEARPFEDEAAPSASALLPDELLRGPHHEVREQVESNGLIRTFTVESEFGVFQARGEGMVRARIREIEAIAVLRERAKSDAFLEAEASVPESPYVRRGSGWIADPDATHAGLPAGGLGRSWDTGSEGASAGADDSEPDSKAPDSNASDSNASDSNANWTTLVGFEARKRELAASLGVDPYTTNPALQKDLDLHAWVSFRSGAPPPQPREPEGTGKPALVEERLRHYSSEDLETLNRIELVAMGVSEDLREKFISNPSYSHKITTVVIESLAALEGTEDRVAFIEAAVNARSEDEAQSYGEVARLMRHYSSRGGELARILQVEGQVAAYTADGTLLVPVVADHAVWSERVAGFAESIARAAGESEDAAKARFLFSGSLSNRAREEIQSLGIEVTQDALATEGQADPAPDAP